jgi:hypothetical protein
MRRSQLVGVAPMPGPGGSVKPFLPGHWLRSLGAPAYTSPFGARPADRPLPRDQGAPMWKPDSPQPPDDDRDDSNRRRNNLLVLAVVMILVVGGVWLVNKLLAMRSLQNCLDSGRTNCVPIVPPDQR